MRGTVPRGHWAYDAWPRQPRGAICVFSELICQEDFKYVAEGSLHCLKDTWGRNSLIAALQRCTSWWLIDGSELSFFFPAAKTHSEKAEGLTSTFCWQNSRRPTRSPQTAKFPVKCHPCPASSYSLSGWIYCTDVGMVLSQMPDGPQRDVDWNQKVWVGEVKPLEAFGNCIKMQIIPTLIHHRPLEISSTQSPCSFSPKFLGGFWSQVTLATKW